MRDTAVKIKSPRQSGAYMRQKPWSALVKIMDQHMFSEKQLLN